jgi:hypothetical protein
VWEVLIAVHMRGKMGCWVGACAWHGRDAGAMVAAHARAAVEQVGQLRVKRTRMGQLRAGALSSRGCPSNVAAAFCSTGHTEMGAHQVASVQGLYAVMRVTTRP